MDSYSRFVSPPPVCIPLLHFHYLGLYRNRHCNSVASASALQFLLYKFLFTTKKKKSFCAPKYIMSIYGFSGTFHLVQRLPNVYDSCYFIIYKQLILLIFQTVTFPQTKILLHLDSSHFTALIFAYQEGQGGKVDSSQKPYDR